MDIKQKNILTLFEGYCKQRLQIDSDIRVKYTENKEDTKTYAHFTPSDNTVVVYTSGRSLGDICRSLAHELIHLRQNELGLIKPDSGKTGSSIENKANAGAGVLMREFGQMYPQIYQ